ncbi:NUDIX domain-containing protein [Motilimonas sp. KMU-193]|uniref:NUDIX domain-containing protein n=1 Tax=Motilimonas sp. KMU-193 TaxID=3388668 RepID=UPI00396B2636
MRQDIYPCSSFLLIQDGQVLLEKRSEHKACDPNLVAIPGGHIEQGESPEQALVREIKEELDIQAGQYQHICSLYHPSAELQLIHYYAVLAWSGEINALEADAVYWRSFAQAELELDTAADKLALAEYLRLQQTI